MTRFCLSFMPESAAQLVDFLKSRNVADMLELRLDALPVDESLSIDWAYTRRLAGKPLLVTCRHAAEGGKFGGTEVERARIYQRAISANVAFVDIESDYYADLAHLLDWSDSPTRLVLSHHIWQQPAADERPETGGLDPERLQEKLRAMRSVAVAAQGILYKLIVTAGSLHAALITRDLLKLLHSWGAKGIIHAMGEAGELSRIMGALEGNAWTYLAPDGSTGTAPGQLTLHEAREVYYLQKKSATTGLYGLLGYPTHQSKGKFFHNLLAEVLDISPRLLYVNFPTPDAELFWDLWAERLQGFSVTIPHKERIFALLQQKGTLSETALRSGVCNTVLRTDAGFVGYNTDVLALVDCLTPFIEELRRGVLVIGTGATTQSTLTALEMLGINKTFITGRNAERLATLSGRYEATIIPLETLPEKSETVGGIIQTTPVGMVPDVQVMPVKPTIFGVGQIVMDVIYNPRTTLFLAEAERRGCTIVSGEEMFIRQAAHQFQLFTGVGVPIVSAREIWARLTANPALPENA